MLHSEAEKLREKLLELGLEPDLALYMNSTGSISSSYVCNSWLSCVDCREVPPPEFSGKAEEGGD